MAIGANSYGSVAEVETLTQQYTAHGVYTAATRPTLTQVEKFIDRVSGMVNLVLAREGFAVPVSQADAKLALDELATEQAAFLCHEANRAGPYAPGSETLRGGSPFEVIRREIEGGIGKNGAGLAALGATRSRALTYGLQCRTETDDGETIEPVFQREMMGNEIVDWDEE